MAESAQSMFSHVVRTRIGLMTYLAPKGSLTDTDIRDALEESTRGCLENNELQIVIDLAAVQLINSAALDLLLGIQEQLIRLGGWIKAVHANPLLLDIFHITGFTDYVSLMDGNPVPAGVSVQDSRSRESLRLGDILVEKGLVTAEHVAEAIDLQHKLGKRMGQIIVDKGWATEQDVLMAIGEQLSVPYVRLRAGIYDLEVTQLLDRDVASRLKVLPLQKVRGVLSLATSDPQAMPSFEEVRKQLGCRVRPVLARREEIVSAIKEAYSGAELTSDLITTDVDDDFKVIEHLMGDDYAAIDEMAEGRPVINLVNSVIQRAVYDGASDIHIEPGRQKTRVRFRIDGVLYEISTLRSELHAAVISRLKVMANLDISERRLPQDGRIQVHTQGRSVDLRFSSLPGIFGEKVVLRVLDKNQSLLDLNRLGFSEHNLSAFNSLLDRSFGLILVTGPTGSGKTTSLYAALNRLNSIEKNIVTIEDPVEYQLDIVNQNEVRQAVGLGFSSILKHTLRQDPDIVMIGEIRERETAEIAVQAALTGHLVLSTLHTNHAVGAITRMIDMGVEPYLLSSALVGVMAQRLVRTICPACKTRFVATPELVERFGWQGEGRVMLARGRGCPDCYDSGFKGRIGIHEVLEADESLQRLITSNPERCKLTAYLEENHVQTLFMDGMDRVRQGKTTIEEISRVVNT